MKFSTFVIAALFLPFVASAATLTYEIDLAKSQMSEIAAFDICGLPKEITLDAREDLPTVVMNKTLVSESGKLKTQTIQATKGSVVGGGLEDPYLGDYRVRVAIAQVESEAYRFGIFSRVEVTTYGPTHAPKAFVVNVDALNYLESAELAEGSVCTGYAYRLK